MPSQNDIDAVAHILESFFKSLEKMKDEKPLWFNDLNFTKWVMMAGLNFLCQLAIASNVNLEYLLTNIQAIWKEIEKSNTPPSIVN